MKVRRTLDGRQATATLAENPPARDSGSLLPITVQVT